MNKISQFVEKICMKQSDGNKCNPSPFIQILKRAT